MGTHGAFGVYVNGETKVSYNHFDSYPSELGSTMIDHIKKILKTEGLEEFKKKAIKLRLVNSDDTPTPKDLEIFRANADLSVSTKSTDEWYCLLRNYQGDLIQTLCNEVMIDNKSFLGDSLFCEYAYIANLDEEVLEFYKGFQETRPEKSRYADLSDDNSDYHAVELIKTIPFSNLLKFDTEDSAELLDWVD